ncbi:MAG: methionine--tRNA ligase [Clostridia bacterium]|nr:methionine--tRNA ligase [Clostridia bacterium]
MKNILIGGAWPYANGSLHIGHIAALLPGDVLARYHRLKGDRVFYVSGSDCYGTPITLRAKKEKTTPESISEHYHEEFCEVFRQLGFSYDLYSKTSCEKHRNFVTEFHKKLYTSEYTEERKVKQAYCPDCKKILTDRLAEGSCPVCGSSARGDGCDSCGEILEPVNLINAKCTDCGTSVIFKESTQIFLLISKLRDELTVFLKSHPYWRKNAVAFTKRYIDEGLRDRAITRDLDWGIDVPKPGYESKKIYIWAENVLGYLSAAASLCEERDIALKDLFGEDSRHYYVHGKDNIPFHTIILPALLLSHGEYLHLPNEIISSEYMTLDGRKISTSSGHAVWAKELVSTYDPDAIRYFFIANGPEKRDSDFSFREFNIQNNSELVGAWGNFVNRTLAFSARYLDSVIPSAEIDEDIRNKIHQTFISTGQKIEKGVLREALDEIFGLIRFANTYYDSEKPWSTRTENISSCQKTIANCIYLVGNITVLLYPFLPFSSEKITKWLGLSLKWEEQDILKHKITDKITILFNRTE